MWHSDRLTVEQAAALVGVPPTTIRARIDDGTIPAHRVRTQGGNVYLIERHNLESLSVASLNSTQTSTEARLERRDVSMVESPPEYAPEAPATAVAELEVISQELAEERVRRAEMERRIQQLEEKLAASQEPIVQLGETSEGNEQRYQADEDSLTCPFLGLSNERDTRLCLSPGRDAIAISQRYADAMCLTAQHRKCSLFLYSSTLPA